MVLVMNYAERLLEWYYENKRELPWRRDNDPYRIWISEIMLQQTQVDTVISYYNRFMDRFHDINILASATDDEVFKLWEGLGYYSRAANLIKCAKIIVSEFDGLFPTDYTTLISLPGIGPYTAGAIMSIAYNEKIPAVDGNVMRVISRHFLIVDDISLVKSKNVFENKVLKLIPEDASSFNQALMELGALICIPQNPKCEICPVVETCEAYKKNIQKELPIKSKKIKVKNQKVAFVFLEIDGKILMKKGKSDGLLSNLWNLPYIVVDNWRDVRNSLDDLMVTDYGYKVIREELLSKSNHVFTHLKWDMRLFRVEGYFDNFKENDDEIWIEMQNVKKLAVSTALKKLMKEIE